MSLPAVEIIGLTHQYGDRLALLDLDLQVATGERFAILGPNGSGKTTLFRLVSTLIAPQQGTVRLFGSDVATARDAARAQIGVVFQAASLDRKLTVFENLRHQGHLYGISGRPLRARSEKLLEIFGIADRRNDRIEQLSGGLRRRVELAKGVLHAPRLLLLDEPSTGLDPAARSDLWRYLGRLRDDQGVTVVLTTHLLDEADQSDRIAIFDAGRRVALDSPEALRTSLGGDSITITTERPEQLAAAIDARFDCEVKTIEGAVRLEQPNGHQWIPRLVEAFPEEITAITLGKPTLADVFVDRTGHRFWGT